MVVLSASFSDLFDVAINLFTGSVNLSHLHNTAKSLGIAWTCLPSLVVSTELAAEVRDS